MDEPKTDKDWLQLELRLSQLFSSAPLAPALSLEHGPEEELSAGRALAAQRMMEAVRDPAKHIILYGERGIGKTSLSNTFWRGPDIMQRPTFTARVQAYPSDKFSSLWKRALDELKTAGQSYCRELSADHDYISPDIIRRELQKMDRNAKPLIIIDEFDLLRRREARESTANLLKTLHDCAMNVTILLIGVAEDVGELITDHQSLRRALLPVKLERMSTTDLGEIFDERIRLIPLTASCGARSKIVNLACGLPYFIQILGKYAAQNAIRNRRLQIVTQDIDAAIKKFVVESEPSFADGYRRATESRQVENIFREVILACAITPTDRDGFFKSSDVVKLLNTILSEKNRKYIHIQQHLSQFTSEKRGNILIRRSADTSYKYRFLDATMQSFIIMKAILDGIVPTSLSKIFPQFFNGDSRDLGDPRYTDEVCAPSEDKVGTPQHTAQDSTEMALERSVIPLDRKSVPGASAESGSAPTLESARSSDTVVRGDTAGAPEEPGLERSSESARSSETIVRGDTAGAPAEPGSERPSESARSSETIMRGDTAGASAEPGLERPLELARSFEANVIPTKWLFRKLFE